MVKFPSILPLLFFFALPAHAHLIELRGHAGLDIVDPSDFNDWLSSGDIKQIYIFPRLGLTAHLRPFADSGWGFGVQWDRQSIKVNSSNDSEHGSAELKTSRLAARAFYRIFDNVFIMGPTAGVGLHHTTELEGGNSSNQAFKFNSADETSLSVGWEVGCKLGIFMLGGEAGYQHYKIESLEEKSGEKATFDIDLSGPYVFGFLGLAI